MPCLLQVLPKRGNYVTGIRNAVDKFLRSHLKRLIRYLVASERRVASRFRGSTAEVLNPWSAGRMSPSNVFYVVHVRFSKTYRVILCYEKQLLISERTYC
jgi:hypothetical protein